MNRVFFSDGIYENNQDVTNEYIERVGCLKKYTPREYPQKMGMPAISHGSSQANRVCIQNFSSEMNQNKRNDELNIYDVDILNMFPYRDSNPIYPLQKAPKECLQRPASAYYRCTDDSLCGNKKCQCMNMCILSNNTRACHNKCCKGHFP